jgi:hypothetical protein
VTQADWDAKADEWCGFATVNYRPSAGKMLSSRDPYPLPDVVWMGSHPGDRHRHRDCARARCPDWDCMGRTQRDAAVAPWPPLPIRAARTRAEITAARAEQLANPRPRRKI